MRTTVDIPDPVYREIKVRAATEGTTIREIILEGLDLWLRTRPISRKPRGKFQLPIIPSKRPGSLKLGEEGVYEYIPFP
jgi:hypothetical protein